MRAPCPQLQGLHNQTASFGGQHCILLLEIASYPLTLHENTCYYHGRGNILNDGTGCQRNDGTRQVR